MPYQFDLPPRWGRRDHVRRQIAETWHRSTGRPAELDAHDLLGRARQQALLEDFGSGSFREGFDRLVDDLNASADLHTFGRWLWRDRLVRLMINRLAVRDWTKKNPLIRHERVEAPIVITGFDLAGVDLLASVLQLDPNVRTPHHWEVTTVCPPQSVGQSPPPAGQQAGAIRPGSCDALLSTEFVGPFELDAAIRNYGDWFVGCDVATAYELHHHQLKILQSALPTTQWVLHGLTHAFHLRSLIEHYADARVVWVHRDPAAVLADTDARRQRALEATSDRSLDEGFVDHWSGRMELGLAALAQVRAAAPQSVFEVQSVELSDDPVGMIEMIYRHFGLKLGDLGRHRMQAALMAGVLPIMPNTGSLTATQVDHVRHRFDAYTSRSEVPSERASP